MVICLELGADLHMAQLMPLPLRISCFIKIQIGFTFLVPAHPGSPGKRAVKWVCVFEVCIFVICSWLVDIIFIYAIESTAYLLMCWSMLLIAVWC